MGRRELLIALTMAIVFTIITLLVRNRLYGHVVWHRTFTGPVIDVACEGGIIYILTSTLPEGQGNRLVCWSANGEALWDYDLSQCSSGFPADFSCLLVFDGNCYLAGRNEHTLVCIRDGILTASETVDNDTSHLEMTQQGEIFRIRSGGGSNETGYSVHGSNLKLKREVTLRDLFRCYSVGEDGSFAYEGVDLGIESVPGDETELLKFLDGNGTEVWRKSGDFNLAWNRMWLDHDRIIVVTKSGLKIFDLLGNQIADSPAEIDDWNSARLESGNIVSPGNQVWSPVHCWDHKGREVWQSDLLWDSVDEISCNGNKILFVEGDIVGYDQASWNALPESERKRISGLREGTPEALVWKQHLVCRDEAGVVLWEQAIPRGFGNDWLYEIKNLDNEHCLVVNGSEMMVVRLD
ncbi:hypothetical protein KDL29_00095 [bacterium]|nr:hypothetical protein [bacterium]